MQVHSLTHLRVLLVFGKAATKKDERFHPPQKPLTTAITARSLGSCWTRTYNITEVLAKDVQGSIILCQEQQVAILSE